MLMTCRDAESNVCMASWPCYFFPTSILTTQSRECLAALPAGRRCHARNGDGRLGRLLCSAPSSTGVVRPGALSCNGARMAANSHSLARAALLYLLCTPPSPGPWPSHELESRLSMFPPFARRLRSILLCNHCRCGQAVSGETRRTPPCREPVSQLSHLIHVHSYGCPTAASICPSTIGLSSCLRTNHSCGLATCKT